MEHHTLITELTQGKHLALQLRTHLQPPSSSSPHECFFLTEMIHSSFDNALSLLNSTPDPTPKNAPEHQQYSTRINKKHTKHHAFKKRKVLPRWTEEVKVCSGTAPEGPLTDGYSWRKYGQKDIHGANFPRCYYRCTHRIVRGCLATKQVQRSDKDPNIFDVTYKGRHTCTQSSHFGTVSVSAHNEQTKESLQPPLKHNPNPELWFDFGEHLKLKSEDFDSVFPPFSFASSSIGSDTADENVFYEPTMETSFMADGGWSGAVVSPATSETEQFPGWDWSSYGGGLPRVQSSEQSELTEIISATTSVANSPIGDWDFSLDKVDFDQVFPFESLDFLY